MSMLTNSSSPASRQAPSKDRTDDLIAMLYEKIAILDGRSAHHAEEMDGMRRDVAAAKIAEANARSLVIEAKAEATTALSKAEAETRRADEATASMKSMSAELSSMRDKLIAANERAARAEATVAILQAQKPAPVQTPPPPLSKGTVTYDVRRGSTGEIVGIIAKPEKD